MTTVEVEADVPESRQVTITLPPGVPTGRVRLAILVEEAWVPPYRPHNPALIPEYRAFHRMLPELVKTHLGQHVAVYQGRVVATGIWPHQVEAAVKAEYGDVPAYIGLVCQPPPPGVVYIGGVTVIRPEADK